jgi:DNA-binding MarR family transcriptional regulator
MVQDNKSAGSMPDNELWWLIASTRFLLLKLINLELARYDITLEQLRVLKHAERYNGTLTMRDLMDLTIRQHNTLTVITQRMMQSGLLAKEKRASDRQYSILLTPKGRTVLSRVKLLSLDLIFSSMSTEKKKHLLSCLDLLYSTSMSLLSKSSEPSFMKLISENRTQKQSIEPPTPDLSGEYIWEQLDRTASAMYRLREIELAIFKLTLIQSHVLKELHENGGRTTIKRLMSITGRQSHSVTTVIARMSINGLVTRTRGKEQKGYIISITPEGEKVFGNLTTYAFSMTLSALNPKQKQHLISCLTPLRNYLRRCVSPTQGMSIDVNNHTVDLVD